MQCNGNDLTEKLRRKKREREREKFIKNYYYRSVNFNPHSDYYAQCKLDEANDICYECDDNLRT